MSLPFLYSVEREYYSRIEDLWSAWVNSHSLEAWYCPTAMHVVPCSAQSEATVGGNWAVAVGLPGTEFAAYFYGKYIDVKPFRLLAHTMCYTENPRDFAERIDAPHHDVVIEFEDRGESSWVKFSQFGTLPEGEAERAQEGMQSYFDNLGNYLAR